MLAVLCAAVFFVPRASYAQDRAAIAGVVKDTSGAVMPGVLVEASSPALIEKTRSVVTDSAGQYKIVDLSPGTYEVSFTLTGFKTVRRGNIILEGNFTPTVNAELQVGALEEVAHRHRRNADRRRHQQPADASSPTARCSTRFRRRGATPRRGRC